MNISIKEYSKEENFIRKMLYEAIFWDKSKIPPSFSDSQKLDYVVKPMLDWMKRENDYCLVAYVDNHPVGSAWYRIWNKDDLMRGFVSRNFPVVVIAVDESYRGKGIATKLIEGLLRNAKKTGLKGLSLSVSKANHALNLYQKLGFEESSDIGDSILMTKIL